MKKNTLLLVIAILLTSVIFAQNEKRIGISTGATLSSFRGNTAAEDLNMKIGFLVGVSFEYYLKENLSFRTNLNFERKSQSNGLDNEMKINSNFDYLTLPILLKYEFGRTNNFFVNGGPFISYLLSATEKESGFHSFDSTSAFKKIDFGVSLGIGTKFILNNKNVLSIELRKNLGLIDISNGILLNGGDIKTGSLNLLVGWDFEL